MFILFAIIPGLAALAFFLIGWGIAFIVSAGIMTACGVLLIGIICGVSHLVLWVQGRKANADDILLAIDALDPGAYGTMIRVRLQQKGKIVSYPELCTKLHRLKQRNIIMLGHGTAQDAGLARSQGYWTRIKN